MRADFRRFICGHRLVWEQRTVFTPLSRFIPTVRYSIASMWKRVKLLRSIIREISLEELVVYLDKISSAPHINLND
ncbi:hypothetical protein CEXT_121391 [Caerostris extrusa]|uniref:Uncharacterized protein n=1 Tax=Caerostris extrusa TaxID=172846 RepID=A0AAV4RN23_CAEEX|nr:hypothetical protein CEXT_121391 [Caerostris extrusa]